MKILGSIAWKGRIVSGQIVVDKTTTNFLPIKSIHLINRLSVHLESFPEPRLDSRLIKQD